MILNIPILMKFYSQDRTYQECLDFHKELYEKTKDARLLMSSVRGHPIIELHKSRCELCKTEEKK